MYVSGARRTWAYGEHLSGIEDLRRLETSCELRARSADFTADVWTGYTGSIFYTCYRGSSLDVTRTAAQTRDLLADYLRISMPIAGTSMTRQGDRRFEARTGNATSLRFDTPFTIRGISEQIETVEIYVSMTDLAIWGIDSADLGGCTWPLSMRSLAIRDFVASILRDAEPMSSRVAAIVDTVLLRFALLVLDDGFPRDAVIADGPEHLRVAALSVIESQFASADLTPESVANSLHTSVRSLYRAFEETGTTVGHLIRDKRLEKSAMALSHAGPHVTIASIARSHGFNGADQFSRAFRRRFGITPQQFRTGS